MRSTISVSHFEAFPIKSVKEIFCFVFRFLFCILPPKPGDPEKLTSFLIYKITFSDNILRKTLSETLELYFVYFLGANFQ